MRLDEINWMDVEHYLVGDDRLMLVLGSCEQHGYLSLLTDVKIPLALADAASRQSGVLVAPPLNFGFSNYFLGYPGTLSLRLTTLLDLVEDLVRSAYRHGFRRILVLNGHGGNDPARACLYELATELRGLRLAWYAWWRSHTMEQFCQAHNLQPAHANWSEAFSFVQVGDLPLENKVPPYIPGLLGADEARQVYGDGSFGGPYQVDPTIMDKLFDALLKDVVNLLSFG